MKVLLDTNICIYIINQRPAQVIRRFHEFKLGEIGVSSVTAAELTFGVSKSGSERNRRALEKFLAPLEIAPFDEQIIWTYGTVRSRLEKAGTPIGSLDTLIAAHALSLDIPLVTNNTREFSRVEGLQLDNWI